MTARTSLTNRRVRMAGDDLAVVVLIDELLGDFGCAVVKLIGKLEVTLRLAGNKALDVIVRDGEVPSVTQRPQARSTPCMLASTYSDWTLPKAFRNQRRLCSTKRTAAAKSDGSAAARKPMASALPPDMPIATMPGVLPTLLKCTAPNGCAEKIATPTASS